MFKTLLCINFGNILIVWQLTYLVKQSIMLLNLLGNILSKPRHSSCTKMCWGYTLKIFYANSRSRSGSGVAKPRPTPGPDLGNA